MAKLILYSPYYKATDFRMGKYVRYIATREGVELPRNTKLNSPATKKQKNLIENMLKDFPNCNELLEYKDYLDKPTIENASEFITRVIEANVQSESMGGYVKYMANRPGVEKIAEHGLFSDNGAPIVLSKVEKELNEYEGNVWTHIISLKREDAARLGFDNVQAWQGLLTTMKNEIAKNMKIAPENLKWYAAFHNESHHPHIHMIGDLAGPCMFAVFMGISRVIYGKMSEKLNLTKTMLACGMLCVICYLTAALSSLPIIGLAGCAFCGIAVGIMWPGTISISSQKCPKGGTAMFAFLALAGDLGATISPAIVGNISNMVGGNLKIGLLVATVFPLVLIFSLIILNRKFNRLSK